MNFPKSFLGKLGLVVVTSVASVTIAGSGVAEAFNVPMNSVNSSKIVNNTIRSIDIKDGTLTTLDVADGTLTGNDVEDESLSTTELLDGSVNGNDIAFGSVSGTDITDGTISSADIATGAVTPADLSVTATTRWAKVGADSTPNLIAHRGASSVSRPAVGNFTVTFAQPIITGGWTAPLNDNASGSAAAGEISVERDNEFDSNSLRVRIHNSAGTAAMDASSTDGFTVTVVC